MIPIGGYFSLEINEGQELHGQALRLNVGRYALEYILKARKYRKVYIPYYICDSVLQPIKRQGYADFHANDKALATVGMKRMSRLTEALMRGIDYSTKANRCICNFHVLDKALRGGNRFKWDIDYGTIPLVYPYYVENGAKLRQHLIDNLLFCARYWPNVLEWCKPEDLEYQLAENLVCIPIDQRYDEEDMKGIIKIIKRYIT